MGDIVRHFNISGDYIEYQYVDKQVVMTAPTIEHRSAPEERATDVEFEQVTSYCRYLDIDGIKQKGIWKPEQVQSRLEKASEQDVNTFVSFLREQEKLGYLNFHGESKRAIYAALRADLPMMRSYAENNFYHYF